MALMGWVTLLTVFLTGVLVGYVIGFINFRRIQVRLSNRDKELTSWLVRGSGHYINGGK